MSEQEGRGDWWNENENERFFLAHFSLRQIIAAKRINIAFAAVPNLAKLEQCICLLFTHLLLFQTIMVRNKLTIMHTLLYFLQKKDKY